MLSNVSGGPSTAASATEDEAAVPAPLIRKGRTLHDYVMKWFQTTKMLVEKQIAYLPTDCKIIAESSSIKCLKCDVILKTGVDEYGGWKISHFVGHHLPRFHKIAPEPQETNSHQPVMDPTRVLNTVPCTVQYLSGKCVPFVHLTPLARSTHFLERYCTSTYYQ